MTKVRYPQVRIHLGDLDQGERRRAALERMAMRLGCTYQGQPSIGKLVIMLADQEMEKMTTQSVKARGSNWSSAALFDGWGNESTEEQCTQAGEATVALFHQIAQANGHSVLWTPATSEVIGNRDDDIDPEQLDEWREQATQEVFDRMVWGE